MKNPAPARPRLSPKFRSTRLLYTAFLSLLLFLAWVPDADAIVRRDDVSENGYLLLAEQFPSVGMISTNGNIRGSGTLIHSQWVLTAAHLSGTPNEFTVEGTTYGIAEFIRHPDWDGNVNNGDDLALARLSSSVPGVTPSDWFTGTDQTGVNGISVGFGRTGTGLTGETSGTSGTKRAGENTIERIGGPGAGTPPDTFFEYDFYAPSDPRVLPLEGMAVLYDSGGPFFIDVGGSYEIAGVHSYVIDNAPLGRGTYGDIVGSTQVSLYDEWITATIPEPSTWSLLFGVGIFGTVFLRRRKSRIA